MTLWVVDLRTYVDRHLMAAIKALRGGREVSSSTLVVPTRPYLDSYVAALERGWSPDNVRGKDATDEQLEAINQNAASFLARLDDPEAKGPSVKLPDGSTVERLPGIVRWIWDGEFCGSIGFRWQHGTSELPVHVLGHIGFAVVPWKRRQGHATRALSLMLDEARARGLEYVELTADPENEASRKVMVANGAELVRQFRKLAAYGGQEALRYRILL
jgi:predicted acetyltransferase